MSETVEKAKSVLTDTSATSSDLGVASKQLALRTTEVLARLSDIDSQPIPTSTGGGPPKGPLRRKLAEDGDADGLVKLSEEEVRLKAEKEILASLHQRLSERIVQVRVEESLRELPKLYKQIAESLQQEEAATRAVAAARAATANLASKCRVMHMHTREVPGAAEQAPKADLSLVREFIRVRGFHHEANAGYGRDTPAIEQFADDVGHPSGRLSRRLAT